VRWVGWIVSIAVAAGPGAVTTWLLRGSAVPPAGIEAPDVVGLVVTVAILAIALWIVGRLDRRRGSGGASRSRW
jgi:hypothetical protein